MVMAAASLPHIFRTSNPPTTPGIIGVRGLLDRPGATAITKHLAQTLAAQGLKILVLDLNPANCDLTVALGMQPTNSLQALAHEYWQTSRLAPVRLAEHTQTLAQTNLFVLPGMLQWLTYPERQETNGWNFMYEVLVQVSQSWNAVIMDLGTAKFAPPRTFATPADFGITCALHAAVLRHAMRIVNVFGSGATFASWWVKAGARHGITSQNIYVVNHTQPPKIWEVWKDTPIDLPDAIQAQTIYLPRAKGSLIELPCPVPQREIASAFSQLARLAVQPLGDGPR
jgi:hypothetical protein